MASGIDSVEVFSNLSAKISSLLFGRTEDDRNVISKSLDELNSLNYKFTVVTNPTKAVLLVNQCCSFIPTEDSILVPKCCQLIWNLVNQQNVCIEGRTLTISVQWCLRSINGQEKSIVIETLQALDALIRSNVDNIIPLFDCISKELLKLLRDKKYEHSCEVHLLALQCLEACTVMPKEFKNQNAFSKQHQMCVDVFKSFLCRNIIKNDDFLTNVILKTCLCGLQNIIIQYPDYLDNELGIILGIVKSFILYGIKGVDYIVPQKLVPSALSIPEVPNVVREKRGGKLTKQRKHRASGQQKKENKHTNEENDNQRSGYIPATTSLEYNSDTGLNGPNTGCKTKTSDSEFSDSDIGKSNKNTRIQGKVRQAALNLFFNVVKVTQKSTMFSYWTSFIPEGNVSGPHNLLTCILKDPSARNRMSALNVLLLLITTSKLFLLQAESGDKSTSFTPFSVILGLMIKQLHAALSLALSEMSVPVLTQVLKCVAALVQATPYHKLSHGLITKVIRNVKPYIYYKDASVQVTALIVLGCILASEPVTVETKEAMLRMHSMAVLDREKNNTSNISTKSKVDDEFQFAQFSDESQSDDDDDDDAEETKDSTIPWLLKRCLNNLGIDFARSQSNGESSSLYIVPAPVKLESLQILSAMSRNYFELIMAPHLPLITKALDISLLDKHMDLRLHAGRAVDFIGQAIGRFVASEDASQPIRPMEQCLNFWKILLIKSLVDLIQCEQHAILRAVGCDCLGSIGAHLFEQLSRNEQILCVTLLFSRTREEENSVKGAAVRALAICVLYPSLRDDPGFVVDTAEVIHRMLNDDNLMVRVKASWSLGNLSDALVLNSSLTAENPEELSDNLILKLLHASIKAASDNDKIKMNAVRAIGNLMQLISESFTENDQFIPIVQQAFNALVKNCTTGSNMKVRWNACYALKNAMRNTILYKSTSKHNDFVIKSWQASVFNALGELVVNFKNFKVRINAALALTSPTTREYYGNFYFFTWMALLKALENCETIEDLNEYKHRDNLVEQVCLSISHLVTLLQTNDLSQLKDIIQLYMELFRIHFRKVSERLVPEKSTIISTAAYTLACLYRRTDNMIVEEKNLLVYLMEIFQLAC